MGALTKEDSFFKRVAKKFFDEHSALCITGDGTFCFYEVFNKTPVHKNNRLYVHGEWCVVLDNRTFIVLKHYYDGENFLVMLRNDNASGFRQVKDDEQLIFNFKI